jgi:hypothetical protein
MPTVFSYVLGRPAVQQTIETYELPEEVTSSILDDAPAAAPAEEAPAE